MINNFEKIRNSFSWITLGREMNEEPRQILLKDISDSHLLHIIGHIMKNVEIKNSNEGRSILNVMHQEAIYRAEHNIFISDYK